MSSDLRQAAELLKEARQALVEADRDSTYALIDRIDAALASSPREAAQTSAPQFSLPEGWRLVPVEPTDSMLDADWDVSMSEAHSNGGVSAAAWRAMLEAAPQATFGNGHSGPGWYAHDADYPEEGAMLLASAPPAAATVEVPDERKTFEAWARDFGFPLEPHATASGFYKEQNTTMAWQGWQARAALSTPTEGGEL